MASRRTFLTAVGAGVSSLLLPSTSQAWGRRRRRCGCQSCGTEGCQSCGTQVSPYFQTAPCPYACPIAYYGNVNGVYYYYCVCCPGGNTYLNSSSNQLISVPQPCNGNCIAIDQNRHSPMTLEKARAIPDRDFYPWNNQFSGGAAFLTFPAPKFTAGDGANAADPLFAQYPDKNGKTRYVGLYDVEIVALGHLRVGHEFKDKPPQGAIKSMNLKKPAENHHHTITDGTNTYHIITHDA
jgi:hypothetical protein